MNCCKPPTWWCTTVSYTHLEEGFQHRVGRARLPGEGEGGPDLGQNLVLSEDLGFHSARELEEMFRRLKALAADKACLLYTSRCV